MANRNAAIKQVSLFTGLYLLTATAFAVGLQNWEFLFYIGVVVLLAFCVWMLNVKVPLTRGVLWCLSLWGLLHMVGGFVPTPDGWPYNGDKAVFYSLWLIPNYLKYDHIIHMFGFGITAWVCWQALQPALKDPRPRFGVLLLCALGAMGLGAFNETIEFMVTIAVPDNNVGGYWNTSWDIVANMAGAIIAVILVYKIYSKESHD